jgi:hypothetical protein
MIRRTVLTVLALVLVAGTAACGGGDDDSASEDTSADGTSTTDAPPGSEAEEGAAPDDSAGEGDVSAQLGVDREFTGDGSEAFCDEVAALREAGMDAAGVDDGAFADAMMAVTPPDEIATEWTNLFTTQKAMAADPSGNALAAMSEEDLNQWASDGNVVAAYLGDVCGLADGGG